MATDIHENSRYQIHQTTVKVSVDLRTRARKQADRRGMKMFDYIERTLDRSVSQDERQLSVDFPLSTNGVTVRKSALNKSNSIKGKGR